ncbi:MAG: transglutaminase-like domain-containing protein, partial [Oceanospirillum sp.]|nr:transglutaminase-like domain-containing protein [Oceanospirillum sp.]
LYGVVRNNVLMVSIDSSAGRVNETYPLRAPLYPMSVINLYPVFHGLALDAQYQFDVYDGESQRMTTLTQQITDYESSDLFSGEAFKVKTSMDGQDVTTWINSKAEPLLEISMNGVFIAGLESESMAKRYLTQAALNKDENLLNFSLVKTDQPLLLPREMRLLELEISGAESLTAFPNDMRQRCEPMNNTMRCRISGSHSPVTLDELRRDYLSSSIAVPTKHPTIKRIADTVTAKSETDLDKITALLNWLDNNIRPQATDVFTALDVLQQRKAECQGFSFLYTSFARSLGIPTRVVNGIVYSEQHPGFLYHTWVESQVDGHWQSIDPTFNQLYADATHIKLVEGENS